MDVAEARTLCHEYVKRQMQKHHARDALTREGFDVQTIETVMAEFDEIRDASMAGKRRLVQAGGAILFVSCAGLFLYLALFNPVGQRAFHLWLLAPATFGLLKMLLP